MKGWQWLALLVGGYWLYRKSQEESGDAQAIAAGRQASEHPEILIGTPWDFSAIAGQDPNLSADAWRSYTGTSAGSSY